MVRVASSVDGQVTGLNIIITVITILFTSIIITIGCILYVYYIYITCILCMLDVKTLFWMQVMPHFAKMHEFPEKIKSERLCLKIHPFWKS